MSWIKSHLPDTLNHYHSWYVLVTNLNDYSNVATEWSQHLWSVATAVEKGPNAIINICTCDAAWTHLERPTFQPGHEPTTHSPYVPLLLADAQTSTPRISQNLTTVPTLWLLSWLLKWQLLCYITAQKTTELREKANNFAWIQTMAHLAQCTFNILESDR